MLNPYSKNRLKLKRPVSFDDTKPEIIRVFESCSQNFHTLKQSGKALITLCPFHEDKVPSFALYKETNTFYCFSCGATGDSYSLAMKLLGYDFKAAAEYCRDNGLFAYTK